MLSVNLESDGMTPALFKWSDAVVIGEKIPESGVKLFSVTENMPGRDGVINAWSIAFILKKKDQGRVSEGWARFLFDEAPDVNSLFDRDIKIFDGPKHIANLVFAKK